MASSYVSRFADPNTITPEQRAALPAFTTELMMNMPSLSGGGMGQMAFSPDVDLSTLPAEYLDALRAMGGSPYYQHNLTGDMNNPLNVNEFRVGPRSYSADPLTLARAYDESEEWRPADNYEYIVADLRGTGDPNERSLTGIGNELYRGTDINRIRELAAELAAGGREADWAIFERPTTDIYGNPMSFDDGNAGWMPTFMDTPNPEGIGGVLKTALPIALSILSAGTLAAPLAGALGVGKAVGTGLAAGLGSTAGNLAVGKPLGSSLISGGLSGLTAGLLSGTGADQFISGALGLGAPAATGAIGQAASQAAQAVPGEILVSALREGVAPSLIGAGIGSAAGGLGGSLLQPGAVASPTSAPPGATEMPGIDVLANAIPPSSALPGLAAGISGIGPVAIEQALAAKPQQPEQAPTEMEEIGTIADRIPPVALPLPPLDLGSVQNLPDLAVQPEVAPIEEPELIAEADRIPPSVISVPPLPFPGIDYSGIVQNLPDLAVQPEVTPTEEPELIAEADRIPPFTLPPVVMPPISNPWQISPAPTPEPELIAEADRIPPVTLPPLPLPPIDVGGLTQAPLDTAPPPADDEIVVTSSPTSNILTSAALPIAGAGALAGIGASIGSVPPAPPEKTPVQKALTTGGKVLTGLSLLDALTSALGGSGGSGVGARGPLKPVFGAQLPAPSGLFAQQGAAPRVMGDIDYERYGYGPERSFFENVPETPEQYRAALAAKPTGETLQVRARGGSMAVKGRSNPSRDSYAVKGAGTGRSDEIPALLSDGEYVIDAETVAMLGDGSSKAGAKRLDDFRVNVRKHKGQNLAKGKFSANAKQPDKYLSGGRV